MVLDKQIKQFGYVPQAIEETIRICQNQNILSEYLEARKKEVLTIMDWLFDQDIVTEIHIANKVKEAEAKIKRAEAKKAKAEVKKAEAKVIDAEAKAQKAEAKAEKAEAEKAKAQEKIKELEKLVAKYTGKVAIL